MEKKIKLVTKRKIVLIFFSMFVGIISFIIYRYEINQHLSTTDILSAVVGLVIGVVAVILVIRHMNKG